MGKSLHRIGVRNYSPTYRSIWVLSVLIFVYPYIRPPTSSSKSIKITKNWREDWGTPWLCNAFWQVKLMTSPGIPAVLTVQTNHWVWKGQENSNSQCFAWLIEYGLMSGGGGAYHCLRLALVWIVNCCCQNYHILVVIHTYLVISAPPLFRPHIALGASLSVISAPGCCQLKKF